MTDLHKKLWQLISDFLAPLLVFGFLLFLVVPVVTFGSVEGGTVPNSLNPLRVGSFPELIELILTGVVMPIGGVVATLAIVYSGFLFVTAQGNPEKLTQARSAFFWAVVGGLILLGSWAIAAGIRATIDDIFA